MTENKFKGLLIWLVSSSINVLIIVSVMILSFIPKADGLHGILTLVSTLYNAMYMPLLVLMNNVTYLYFVVLIPGAIMATVSYILGIKGYKCIFPEPKSERNRQIK